MIKLKPEKSRKAVIAFSFAIFSPSLNIPSQKQNTNSLIGVNSETDNPPGVERDIQSLSGTINGSSRATSIGIISTTETTTDKNSGILTIKSNTNYSRFSRIKIKFQNKWSLISTTMAWNFQKMLKIYQFDYQLFYQEELKYTVIFFLYN